MPAPFVPRNHGPSEGLATEATEKLKRFLICITEPRMGAAWTQ